MKLFLSTLLVIMVAAIIGILFGLFRIIYPEPWFIVASLIAQFVLCGLWGWHAADVIRRFKLY